MTSSAKAWGRLGGGSPWRVDAGLAAGTALAVGWTSWAAYGNQPAARPLDALGWALLAVASLGLAWCRRRPEISLLAAVTAASLYFARGYAYAFWPVPALIAMFAVVSSGRRRLGWTAGAVLVAVPGVGVLLQRTADDLLTLLVWGLIVALIGQLGEVSRARHAYTAEVEARALAAERGREEEALRRAQQERLRISRELHDVTSHTVSLIALQAAVAAEAIDRDGGPRGAREALAVIRAASREALTEMKAVLGTLPQPAREWHPTSDVPAEFSGVPGGVPPGLTGVAGGSLPGLHRLGDLAAAVTDAGVRVRVAVDGDGRALPPAVDLAAYRIAQEALTNTLRHAGATSATVTVRFEPGAVAVEVADDGSGCDRPVPGFGLRGMAGRVAAAGGTLHTGNAPGGGFRVAARLPLGAAP